MMVPPAGKKPKTMEDYEKKIAQLKDRVVKLEDERRANSLLSVLPGDAAKPIPLLECTGSGKSHLRPKNNTAKEIMGEFVAPDLGDVDTSLGLNLGEKSSCLRALINNSANGVLQYENEYDVHDFVQQALRDATAICNDIIKKQAAKSGFAPPIVLGVRRESPLYSSILDHVVVFDVSSNTPVFSVETKQVWQTLTPEVFGQVYDQLCEMQAKGHPNPFGALTCFDMTLIVWLDNSSTQNVINDLVSNKYSEERICRIVGGLPGARNAHDAITAPRKQQPTQSPVKEKAPAADAQFWQQGFTPTATRQVTLSDSIGANDLVAAFVSAIFCSLDGFQNPHEIKSFQNNQRVEVEALCLDNNIHTWGTFRTIYQGHKKTTFWAGNPKQLYLVDQLGVGTTSKAYRALTPDGYECVVKMYVKRRGDDKKRLTKKEFEANAKAAVTREVQAYKNIYGDELKGYVWQQTLDGMCCVIHPYFKHPDKNKRFDLLPQIEDRLRACFVGRNKCFATSDQAWCHVGWFNGKLYLFDLADLETHTGSPGQLVQNHINQLRARHRDAGDGETQASAG